MDLHDEAAAAFARDGVACVRSVLDPGEVAEAAAAIDEVLARRCQLAVVGGLSGVETGPPRMRFFRAQLLVKEVRTRQRTHCNQGQPYYNMDSRCMCTGFTVDRVSEDGCPKLGSGSYLGSGLMPSTSL